MEKKYVTVGELKMIRECKNKYEYAQVGLSSLYKEQQQLLQVVLQVLKNGLFEKKTKEQVLQEMKVALLSGCKEEWYTLEAAKEKFIEKIERQCHRLCEFLYESALVVEKIDVPYLIGMGEDATFQGVEIQCLSGKADMIVMHPDGQWEAILFVYHEVPYSYRARKAEHKVEHAVELNAMALGLVEEYPEIKCSIYALKGKDDKVGVPLPAYDYRQGKNIVSHIFVDTKYGLQQSLLECIAFQTECSCQTCGYQPLCQSQLTPVEVPQIAGGKGKKEVQGKAVSSFTSAQREVVEHVNGPLSVIAVPGAGKTFSLVQRMLHLIQKEGVPPQQILFVTFTNKACGEIKERVEGALDTEMESKLPSIFTFNGLGYQILKENPTLLGRRVCLASTLDRLSLIRDVLKDAPPLEGYSYEGIYLKYGLIRALDNIFTRIDELGREVWEGEYKKDAKAMYKLYVSYKKAFQERGFCSYDEQISLVNELFKKRESLAQLYSKRFRYIMVDEFQDVSKENVEFIYHIASHHRNLTIVGDDDQSIYAFRGGSNAFMLAFAEDFAEAKVIRMEDNFRSNTQILNASEALISENVQRFQKTFVGHKEAGNKPIYFPEFTLEKLPSLVGQILGKGYAPGDIALIGRYNKTLDKAREVLRPYVSVGMTKDYVVQDPVFLSIFDILTLCFSKDYNQEMSAYRLLRMLQLPLKKAYSDLLLLESVCKELGTPFFLFDENTKMRYESLRESGNTQVQGMAKLYLLLSFLREKGSLEEKLGGILLELYGIESHPILDVLQQLVDERALEKPFELYQLMKDMVLFEDDTRVGYALTKDKVQFLTAHDSKGKEFPIVIVLSVDEFGEGEEERRLLYVSMTRAEKGLFITKAQHQRAQLMEVDWEDKLHVVA